ncbi:MAG: hypothetical protein Q9M36_01700 [Sulfurovum sp.]|nr:hypothetical protein [Sulfurovum sp.]
MNALYFLEDKYAKRVPEAPQKQSDLAESLFQFFAVITLMLGVWYLHFRWTSSLNMEALWFAIPLAFAETMMFVGTIFVVINFWKTKDTPQQIAPNTKMSIDIYIPVFNEDPALVKESIRASKAVKTLDAWTSFYLSFG